MFWFINLLVILFATVASAQTTFPVNIRVMWEPSLQYEDGSPADLESISHDMLYMCESPIVAGGANGDNPNLERPICAAGELLEIRAEDPKTEISYEAAQRKGELFFRASTVSVHKMESKLSAQVSYKYNFHAHKPPRVVTIEIQQIPEQPSQILRRQMVPKSDDR